MNIRHITVTDVTNIGDPFVLRVGNTYYLYATSFKDGFDYRTSSDLVHWSAPKKAYTAGERSFGYTVCGRPEVTNTKAGISCIIRPAAEATIPC